MTGSAVHPGNTDWYMLRLIRKTLRTIGQRLSNLAHMPERVWRTEKMTNDVLQVVVEQGHQISRQFAELLRSSRGDVFLTGESPEGHRKRLIGEFIAEHPDAAQAYKLILVAIGSIPNAREREHVYLHEVRYLCTYLMVPGGPGRIIDVAASDIYAAPLISLKEWTISPIRILEFDLECERFPFDDNSVDGVLFCEVIEHFTLDPMFCLIEINRVLRFGGFIILTTPNAASWFGIYQALQKRHPSRWPVYGVDASNRKGHIHAREYVTSEIVQLLEAAGFAEIVIATKDTGITAPYRPIPGFDSTHRGETIFCRAYKHTQPLKRFVAPIYLEDKDYDLDERAR
jgi:SAM-dependent methyltransferase